jgi:hypothetical protein
MSDLSAYAGRTVDVVAWHGAAAAGDLLLEPALAPDGRPAAVCTGLQKLAQRFFAELLTETDSVRYRAGRGCRLMTLIRQGRIRTSAQLRSAFTLAETTVGANLRGEETAAEPADERYGRATAVTAVAAPGRLLLRVRLESRAGAAAEWVLPVPYQLA